MGRCAIAISLDDDSEADFLNEDLEKVSNADSAFYRFYKCFLNPESLQDIKSY
jgi:hypothetical protein